MNFLLFGFLGGIIRGIIGLIKYSQSYKDVEIRPWYFGGTVVLSGIIGLVSSWIAKDMGASFMSVEAIPLSVALVVGYAGGDFIENIFKIITRDPQLFKILGKMGK